MKILLAHRLTAMIVLISLNKALQIKQRFEEFSISMEPLIEVGERALEDGAVALLAEAV
jgi:hypothetical protein